MHEPKASVLCNRDGVSGRVHSGRHHKAFLIKTIGEVTGKMSQFSACCY